MGAPCHIPIGWYWSRLSLSNWRPGVSKLWPLWYIWQCSLSPVFVNKDLLEQRQTHSPTCDLWCFPTTAAGWSSYERDCMAHKATVFTTWPFTECVCWPPSQRADTVFYSSLHPRVIVQCQAHSKCLLSEYMFVDWINVYLIDMSWVNTSSRIILATYHH